MKEPSDRHSESAEIPTVNPEDQERAAREGARIVARDPKRMREFVLGNLTLGELEGIGKQEQYEIAKLGYGHLEQGQLDRSREVFRGLVALDPYDAYFHTALGVIAQKQAEYGEAEKHFDRALEINPYSPVALANRGEVRLLLGRLVEAADDLVRAIENDPDGREPITGRAHALAATVRSQLQDAV